MTMDFWVHFGVSIFKGVLDHLKKDPTKIPAVRDMLREIRDALNVLLGG